MASALSEPESMGHMSSSAKLALGSLRSEPERASDESLMSRISQGDRGAFAALLDRYLPRVLRLAARMVGNGSEAEDIAQDVFTRVWVHAGRWNPEKAQFATWLYRIAINRCLDHRRRRWFLPIDRADAVEEPAPGADTAVFRNETSRLVASAVQRLPARQRAALVLCHFEEMSTRDAATALSLSIAAVESLLVRARRTLRVELESLKPSGADAHD